MLCTCDGTEGCTNPGVPVHSFRSFPSDFKGDRPVQASGRDEEEEGGERGEGRDGDDEEEEEEEGIQMGRSSIGAAGQREEERRTVEEKTQSLFSAWT